MSSTEGLVGREAELALAAAAVRRLSEGRASVLVIEGEAGIGKTRLVQSIIDDARSRDVAVFYGQAHPFERTRPFGVVAGALGVSRRSPEPRRAAIGALLGGPRGSAPASAAGDIQYRVVEEIVDLVETSCAERPVLLVAEDLHWADGASLVALSSVARRLPLAALLVVVTARPSPMPVEVVRLLDDLAAGGASTVQLQPLKSDDVAVLAGQVIGASPGPALSAMLAKAGGNPLWAAAMVRSLSDEGMLRRDGDAVEVTTSELPASLSDLVVRADRRGLPGAPRGSRTSDWPRGPRIDWRWPSTCWLGAERVTRGVAWHAARAASHRRRRTELLRRQAAAGWSSRRRAHHIGAGQSCRGGAAPALRSGVDAIIATATGDHRAARELADGFTGSLEGEQLSYNAGVLAFAAAGLKVAEGDRQGAYDLLLRCWRFDAARENRFYHRCLAPDLVRLALALGHRDVAAEVAGTVTAGVGLAPKVPTVRSLALRCQGLVDGEVEPIIEAVTLARQAPLLVEHTGACEDAARLLAQDGRRNEAAALLGEALERYEQAGADAWAGRVRAKLRSIGIRPGSRGPRHRPTEGWESLTATERAVSLLVAEGLTNGAVARRLYISPHTVNTHLRHVFAKLGVSNRVALAAVAHHSIE